MYYWNKNNFESLGQLAVELQKVNDLEKIADYCVLREKGLRKQALAVLHSFLQQSTAFHEERKLELVMYLLDLHWALPQAHQFLAQPLIDGFILPVLRHATHSDNNAFRYLALFQAQFACGEKEEEALRLVLDRDPSDAMVRKALLSLILHHVDFSLHHLHESLFIGSEEYCQSALLQVAALLESVEASQGVFDCFIQEHNLLLAKFNDWLEYKKTAMTLSFPAWCAAMGRQYDWCLTVYYDA